MIFKSNNKKWEENLNNLFNSKTKMPYNTFLEKVSVYKLKRLYIDEVYQRIYDYLPKSVNKNIYPNDNILIDYDIDDEDLGDIMIEIFKEHNIKFPSRDDQDKFYEKFGEEVTVLKMIQFIDFFGNGVN